jgi:DNA-binding NarL/FixJ family response regulator
MTIRILIADDHAMFRSGLKALLEKEPDFEVVAEASTGPEAVEKVKTIDLDLLILDLSMPGGLSGGQIAEAVIQERPELGVVVLTMHEDEYYLKQLLRIGAKAFLLKKSNSEEMLQAIRSVSRGDLYVDPTLTRHLVPSFVGKPAAKPQKRPGMIGLLTKREIEVCRELALGHTNSEVGEKLFISERTVETHRTNIMNKLELRNRAELVRFAIENGLLNLHW